LSLIPSPLCFSTFQIVSPIYSLVGLDLMPPTQLGMTGKHHHAQLIGRDGISLTFCPGWLWTIVFLISSWVARITDMR
jgi:hypothetical protein